MMEQIYLNQLPECLQKSLLVKQMINNDSDNSSEEDILLSIPKKYIPKVKKKSKKFKIKSLKDFETAIDVLRYWMVDDLPEEIYDYMFLPDAFSEICKYRYNYMNTYKIPDDVLNFFDKFNDFKPVQDDLTPIFNWRYGLQKNLISIFIKKNNLKLISYLSTVYKSIFKIHYYHLERAAKHGHFDCFKYLHSKVYDKSLIANLYEYALQYDNLDFLKYLQNHNVKWYDTICSIAARYNSLKCLKYLNDQIPSTYRMKWISSERDNYTRQYLSTCVIALKYEHYNAFVFAHENGCTIDYKTVTMAVKYHNFEILDYICRQQNTSQITYDLYQYCTDCPKIFKYLYDKLHSWPHDFLKNIIENYVPYVKNKRLECFYFYLENGGSFSDDLSIIKRNLESYEKYNYCDYYYGANSDINSVTREGCVEMVKYLHEFGGNINTLTFYMAIESGNLECLKYLHDQNTDYTKSNKQLEKEFQQSDILTVYKLPAKLLECAISKNEFEIVKYLYENGCPLTKRGFEFAVKNKNKEMIDYLYEKNCPIGTNILKFVKVRKNPYEIYTHNYHSSYFLNYKHQYQEELEFYNFFMSLIQ